MNRCPNCGAQNRIGARFCTSCGFKMPESVSKAPTPAPQTEAPARNPWHIPPSASQTPTATETSSESGGEAPSTVWTTPIPADVATGTADDSWGAPPPVDTAVPVSDAMIASLLGEAPAADAPTEPATPPAASASTASDASSTSSASAASSAPAPAAAPVEPAVVVAEEPSDTSAPEPPPVDTNAGSTVPSDDGAIAMPASSTVVITSAVQPGDATIDSLLKLARELEYGLMELGDAKPSASAGQGADAGLLSGALNGLTSEEDLVTLRDAIATAQDRPRDVDVMLDLVQRADAIATIIGERDQLKARSNWHSAIRHLARTTNSLELTRFSGREPQWFPAVCLSSIPSDRHDHSMRDV